MATPISNFVVFIDTNLDTHFALTLSDNDTVSDLKNRILLDHPSCFPNIGQIQIHAVKVKYNSHFYLLPDSVIVKTAFSVWDNKTWFINVDISALEQHCRPNQKLLPHVFLNHVEIIAVANKAVVDSGDDNDNNNNNAIILPCNNLLENKKDEREDDRVVSPCVLEQTGKEAGVKLSGNDGVMTPLDGSIPKRDGSSRLNNEVQSFHMEWDVDGAGGKGNKDDWDVGMEESLVSVRSENRKRKSKRKREDTADVGGDKSKEQIPSDCPYVLEQIEKEAVKNLDTVPGLNIDGEVENKEVPSSSVPSAKRRKKSKKEKEGIAVGHNSKEKEEIPSDHPHVSEHTEKEATKNLVVSNLHIECEVDGSGERNSNEDNVHEKVPLVSVPSAKIKKKSKKKSKNKKDTVGGDNSKDNIAAVDNPIDCPSERASNFNNFQVPQSENKQDEKEEIPFDRPCDADNTEKEAVKKLQMVPNSHIECEVDGSSKGSKIDSIVCEEGTFKSPPCAKSKQKSKSKRKKEDTVGGDISKDSIASVNNPLVYPSEKTSGINNFQVAQSENKQDEKEEIPFDCPCDADNTEKEAVKKLQMVPNSHIECEVDGSSKGSKIDSIVCEEGTFKSPPCAKSKQKSKSKRKKEDTVGGDISKDSIASVDNPLVYPSEKTSGINNFQVAQSENKQDEKEISFDRPHVPEHTEKFVQNLEIVPNSHIECEIDESNKGIKGDSIVSEKGTSNPTPSAKKKHKSGRKKEDMVRDDTLKEKNTSVVVPVQQDILVLANTAENVAKEVIKETEVPKEHQNTESNGNNTKNDGNAVSMMDASELKSPVKKKPKKSKRSLSHNSKEPLKVETASQKDQAQTADGAHRERKESEDIILSKTNLDKMEIGTDACKETIQSTTKEAGNCKNQSDIEIEVHPSDANETKDLMEDNENVVVGHCHESEVGQIKGAAEGEVSPQNDDVSGMKEPVQPVKEKKKIKKIKNKGGQIKGVAEGEVLPQNDEVSGMKEPVKPVKEKKEIKKVKNKGEGKTPRKDNGLGDASESETVVAKSLKATICDPMPGNIETQENPLNHMEGKVMQQEEMQGSVLSVSNKGGDSIMDNADSMEQTKTKSNAENVDEQGSKRLKKKPNNKQSSTQNGTSDMLTNGHVFDRKKERDAYQIDKAPNEQKTEQVANLRGQSDSAMSSIGANRKPRGNASVESMDLVKQREHIPISNGKLEGSNKMVQNKAKKASGNSDMGVVSNLQPKKSLLEGAIFKDDDSSASEDEDENQVDNSDASTRTPSDNSLVSDFDGYDSPGLDSQQNGTYNGKMLDNDERSPLKAGKRNVKDHSGSHFNYDLMVRKRESFSSHRSNSSGVTGDFPSLTGTTKMSIDHVFKSSTRYKKARLTASQLDDSQLEFVPDSLAQ